MVTTAPTLRGEQSRLAPILVLKLRHCAPELATCLPPIWQYLPFGC